MREDFVGAVGLNRIARFRLDPRDVRSDADYYDMIADRRLVRNEFSEQVPMTRRRLPSPPTELHANA
jgi:hypothetical protein